MKNKQLYYGDNLEVLMNKIKDETVDLCYIDPPFNSKRNYFQIYNNLGTDEDKAQAQAFVDTWTWDDAAEYGLKYLKNVANIQKFTPQIVELMKGLEMVLKKGSLLAYLVHMTLRIVEIHRVLKKTGSFYLHCDPTASHYLKLICDGVFCGQMGGEFRNEIIWHYSGWNANLNAKFNSRHDCILFYTKSTQQTFHSFSIPWESEHEYVKKRKQKLHVDENGKKYVMSDAGSGQRIRRYLSEAMEYGKPVDDVWHIDKLNNSDKERLGYPTQKPEALLERIIKASSNEGDVVLDAYCGCGTTVSVAERLNRKWIGIDITYQSISLILKRLKDTYKIKWATLEKEIFLDGVPKDRQSAIALANRKDDKTRKEFEKWAILTYSNNLARINQKKGADGGIDGMSYFVTGPETTGQCVFQVKSGKVNRATIAILNSDRQREKAEIAILITLENPTKPMRDEAKQIGKYTHTMFRREDDVVQIVTIDEILKGQRLDLPMTFEVVKSAEAHVNTNGNDSMELDF